MIHRVGDIEYTKNNACSKCLLWASRMALVVKNPPDNAGDAGSVPGLGGSPGGGNGNPFQYSCQENPKDCGAWWATVHGFIKSQT